ncbi:MAG: hypothetical protein ACREQQ_18750 [Candidatus Binatia bacterium]
MADIPNAADLAREIADALEADGISYAIGGAIALGFYTAPRATRDVDVNVFVPPAKGLGGLLDSLGRLGFEAAATPEALRRSTLEEGQFQGSIRGMRVDVFVPALDYYGTLETRRRRVSLLGRPLWILAPEDLVVLKMVFFRRKDLADVEAELTDQKPELDRAFIRSMLTELVGGQDPRLTALDDIERDVDRAN